MIYALMTDWTISRISSWGSLLLTLFSLIVILITILLIYKICPEDGYLLQGFGDFILLSIVGVILYLSNIYLNHNTFRAPSKLLFLIDAILILRGVWLCSHAVVSLRAIPAGIAVSFLSGYLFSIFMVTAARISLAAAILIIAAIVALKAARYFFMIDMISALLNGISVPFYALYVFIKELTGNK